MTLDRLTQITSVGITSGITLNNATLTGVTTIASLDSVSVGGTITAVDGNFSSTITAVDGNFSGNITAVGATFSGNVSIAGTLTYEDVTNIDSVGLITARSGLNVTGGSVGIGTDNPAAGSPLHINGGSDSTNTHLRISADRGLIARLGDTSGAAQSLFDLYDTDGSTQIVKFISGGGNNWINTGGNLGIGTDNPASLFHINSGQPRLTLSDTGTNAHHRVNADSSVGNLAFDVDYGSATSTPSYVVNIKGSEKFRIKENGDVNVSAGGSVFIGNGNLVFSTSGTGIDFSATTDGSGTTTSEILDDYEEGTWTPIFSTNTGGASGQTYSVQRGRYTKIGRIVHCSFDMQLSTKGTFSGNYITIGGLPYVNMEAGNAGGTATIGYYVGFSLPANSSTITAYINTNQVYLMTPGDSVGSDYLTVTDATTQMSSSSRLIGQMTLFLTS